MSTFDQLSALKDSPKERLNALGQQITKGLRQIKIVGFDATLSSSMVTAADGAYRSLPKTTLYGDVRKTLKLHVQSLSDFDTACAQHILVGDEIAEAADSLRKQFIADMKPLVADLPQDDTLNLSKDDKEELKQKKLEGQLVAGDDNSARTIQRFYDRTNKLPDSFKQNSGVQIFRTPIVVLGIFGTTLDKMRSLGVNVREFVEGYSVFDNQLLLGLDLKTMQRKYGMDAEKLGEGSPLHDFANDLLVRYNAKHGRKLALANEEPHRFKGVLYYWMLPERQLSAVISRVPHLGDQWGFPTKQTLVSPESDDRNVTKEKLEHIFNMAYRGRTVAFIAEKLALRPSVVAAILSGNDMVTETFEMRKKLRAMQVKDHATFVEQKKSITTENLKIAERAKRLHKATPQQLAILRNQ